MTVRMRISDRLRGDAITWRGWKMDPAWFASQAAYLISDSNSLHYAGSGVKGANVA